MTRCVKCGNKTPWCACDRQQREDAAEARYQAALLAWAANQYAPGVPKSVSVDVTNDPGTGWTPGEGMEISVRTELTDGTTRSRSFDEETAGRFIQEVVSFAPNVPLTEGP